MAKLAAGILTLTTVFAAVLLVLDAPTRDDTPDRAPRLADGTVVRP